MSVILYFSRLSESYLSEYCTNGFGFIRWSLTGDEVDGDEELLKLLFLDELLSIEGIEDDVKDEEDEEDVDVGLFGRYLSFDNLTADISSLIGSLTFLGV